MIMGDVSCVAPHIDGLGEGPGAARKTDGVKSMGHTLSVGPIPINQAQAKTVSRCETIEG